MKRTWQTVLASLALGLAVSAASADPPQNLVVVQEKLPSGPVSSVVAAPVQFDAPAGNYGGGNGGGNGGFEAGVTGYLLKPYFGNNTAFTQTVNPPGNNTPITTTTDFNWDFNPAYAVWLGWTNDCGFGVRGRFFNFDQNPDPIAFVQRNFQGITVTPPIFPGGGVIFGAGFGNNNWAFDSDLHIQTFDVEATWTHRAGNWGLLAGVGGRYLHISQDYNASMINRNADLTAIGFGLVTETRRITSGHNFNGGGPTVSFEASYNFGNSGLSIFGNVRGSLLVGTVQDTTSLTVDVTTTGAPLAGFNTFNQTRTNRDSTLPVAEFELGLQYTADMGRFRPFGRIGVVNQTYFDAGSSTARDGNLSLFGGFVSLGVRY